MALAPLRNALTFLDNAPSAMNLRENPADNDPLWVIDSQYFKNDVVVSPQTGGMYVFTGAGDFKTSIRGGDEPWLNSFSAAPNWKAFSPYGLNDVTTTAVTVTPPAVTAATPVVVTAGSLGLSADLATAGAVYLVTYQGTWATTGGVAFAATDQYFWSFDPDGTGSVTVSASSAPGAVVSPYQMSGSVVVAIPADGTQITGALTSGATALGVAPLLSNLRVTYSRIQ